MSQVVISLSVFEAIRNRPSGDDMQKSTIGEIVLNFRATTQFFSEFLAIRTRVKLSRLRTKPSEFTKVFPPAVSMKASSSISSIIFTRPMGEKG